MILEIQNLKCGGCANTIIKKLLEIKPLNNIDIDNETNSVSFSYDNNETLLEVKRVLHKIGYPVVGEKNAVTTKAKSFVSCAIGRMNG